MLNRQGSKYAKFLSAEYCPKPGHGFGQVALRFAGGRQIEIFLGSSQDSVQYISGFVKPKYRTLHPNFGCGMTGGEIRAVSHSSTKAGLSIRVTPDADQGSRVDE